MPPIITGLNLKLLQAFVLVAECRSFRDAAEMAGRSHSVLSVQIKQLERQLGLTLFQRTTRSVELTAEGAEIYDSVRGALAHVASSIDHVREAAVIKRSRVAIACSPSIAARDMPHILFAYAKTFPGVEVTMREVPSGLGEIVQKGEVDFAIGPDVPGLINLRQEVIVEDPLVAVVPSDNPLNAETEMPFDLLSLQPLLLPRGNVMRDLLEVEIQKRGRQFKTLHQCTQVRTVIALADAGLGIAVAPKSVVIDYGLRSAHAIGIVAPTMALGIALICPSAPLKPAASRLASIIRERLRAKAFWKTSREQRGKLQPDRRPK